MGGSSSPATSQQTSKVELPAWVNQASEANYKLAQDVAGRPLEQYAGPTVAGPSSMTTDAWNRIMQSVGSLDPYFRSATDSLAKSTDFQNRAGGMFDKASATLDATQPLYNKMAGTLDSAVPILGKAGAAFDRAGNVYGEAGDIFKSTAGPLDINRFLNPYTQEVEDRAVANANTSLDRNLLGVANKARQAGAFGGSRSAVESAVTRGEGIRNIGDLTAALRKAGIDYATDTAIKDRAGVQAAAQGLLGVGSGITGTGQGYIGQAAGLRDVASGYGNTAAGLQGTAAGYNTTGSGLLGGSAAAGNTAAGLLNTAAGQGAANANDISSLLTAGSQEQQSRQAQIDAAMKQFYERRDYPIEGLNMRLAALGMSPYGKTETTNKTATSEDKGPDWASILLGGAKIGASVLPFSDRRAKTDIKKLTDGEIPLYAYRYKGDPKTYPKVVGPMAQDIEKVYPSAIKKVGKYKAINLDNLMEVLS